VDLDRIIADIGQIIEQRRSREFEPPPMAVPESRPGDPPQAAREATLVQENLEVNQTAVQPAGGFQYVRKPGHFGKGGWMRVPSPR
jgi:hypothetical protein